MEDIKTVNYPLLEQIDLETLDVDLYQVEAAEMNERLRQAQSNCGVLLAARNSKDDCAPSNVTHHPRFLGIKVA